MKNSASRAILVNAIRDKLFPELLKNGFIGPDLEEVFVDDNDTDTSPKALLFHFRRSDSKLGRLALTIDVKSFSRPTFQIMAGHVPEEGVKRWCPEEIVPADKADALMLQIQAQLQASPRKGYAPFRPSLLAHIFGSRKDVYRSVQHAVELLPDLIKWLDEGTPSPNVWVVKFPRPGDAPKPSGK